MTIVRPPARAIAMHEAHHAAALLLQGMTPKYARIDLPDDETAGLVEIDWGDGVTPDKAKAVLIAVLAGAMCESVFGWDWPLDPERIADGARRDAEHAQRLAEYLKFEEQDWLHAVWEANQLAGSTQFRVLAVAIADELERVEVLNADQLLALKESVCD